MRRVGGGERRGGGGRDEDASASAAEIWKRGKLKRARREANRVADRLLSEFEGSLRGGSGSGGRRREEVWRREEEQEEDGEWDRDEWRYLLLDSALIQLGRGAWWRMSIALVDKLVL